MKPDEFKRDLEQCTMMLIDGADSLKTIYGLQWSLLCSFDPKIKLPSGVFEPPLGIFPGSP